VSTAVTCPRNARRSSSSRKPRPAPAAEGSCTSSARFARSGLPWACVKAEPPCLNAQRAVKHLLRFVDKSHCFTRVT
jgi:hypothetical protein